MNKLKSAIPVGDLGQYATILVIVGVTIGIGGLILLSIDDTGSVSPVTTAGQSVTTLANDTYKAITNPRAISITNLNNATHTFPVANITLLSNRTSSMFKYTQHNASGAFATGTYTVNYTYSADSAASDALINASDGLEVFGDWLVIIAVVIVAVVVLTLIKYL